MRPNEITPDLERIYFTICSGSSLASFSPVKLSSLVSSFSLISDDVEKSFSLPNGASLSAYYDPLSCVKRLLLLICSFLGSNWDSFPNSFLLWTLPLAWISSYLHSVSIVWSFCPEIPLVWPWMPTLFNSFCLFYSALSCSLVWIVLLCLSSSTCSKEGLTWWNFLSGVSIKRLSLNTPIA